MTICNVRSSNLNSDVQPAIMLAFFSEALKQFWPDALPGITSDSTGHTMHGTWVASMRIHQDLAAKYLNE